MHIHGFMKLIAIIPYHVYMTFDIFSIIDSKVKVFSENASFWWRLTVKEHLSSIQFCAPSRVLTRYSI